MEQDCQQKSSQKLRKCFTIDNILITKCLGQELLVFYLASLSFTQVQIWLHRVFQIKTHQNFKISVDL